MLNSLVVRIGSIHISDMNVVRGSSVFRFRQWRLSGTQSDKVVTQLPNAEGIQEVHEGDVECNICKTKYLNPFQLQRHIDLKHKNIKRFECATCGKGLATEEGLRRHQNVHKSQDERIRCPECPESSSVTFSSKRALKIHNKEHHSAEELPWLNCPHCKGNYKTQIKVSF